MKISGLILVKNNADSIEYALMSLVDYLDEIVIIDSGAKDGTIDICAQYTNKIFYHEFNGNFGEQKNWGMKKCAGDWIFVLDADEFVGTYFDRVFPFLNRNYRCLGLPRYNLVDLEPMSYVTTEPLYRNWQSRFIRNDGKSFYSGSPVHHVLENHHRRLHCSVAHVFHLDYLLHDREARLKKVAFYDAIEQGTGYPRMYLFEDYPYKTATVMEPVKAQLLRRLKQEKSWTHYELHGSSLLQAQQCLRAKAYNILTRARGNFGI